MVEIAVAHDTTPFVSAYPWSAGFGAKFANPATLPASTGRGPAFSDANDALAVAHDTTPFVTAYPWSGAGFGVKFANPGTLPTGNGRGTAYTDADDAVAVSHLITPFVSVYPWSGAGFGAKFANPATTPTGTGERVDFTTADDAVVVGHQTTPFVTAYPWSGAGFGVKFANPGTLPTGNTFGAAFTTADDAVVTGHLTTPFVTAYPWSVAGFGAKFANPATLPAGNGQDAVFTAADDAVAVPHATTPFITTYPWSGAGFGAKLANPASLPPNSGLGAAYAAPSTDISVAHVTAPFVTAYPWSGAGFGAVHAAPGTLPTGTGRAVAYTNTPAVPPVPPTLPASEPAFILLDNTESIAAEDAFVVLQQTVEDQIKAVFGTTIDPVENVAIEIVGGDCDTDATQLPGLKLTWNQVTPPSGTAFISYDIMRRVAGETDFTRIAIVNDITTVTFTDFCVTSRVTYEYSVRWRATSGAAQVTSADTDPPVRGLVTFDFLFLHLEKDASVFVRLDSYRADKRRLADRRQLAVWGRTKPTVAIGEQIWHQLRIPGLPQLLESRDGVWESLLTLMDEEREQTSVVCVRFGRASEQYFCNTIQETQRQAQKTYTPDLTLVEVHFDEAV